MQIPIRKYAEQMSKSIFFLFIVSTVIGIILFNVLIGIPRVGIITLDTPVMSENVKNEIIDMLMYASNDRSVKAVMITIDSPGGEASKIEEIYLEILKLKAKKPVVVSVNSMGLSGGYYIAAAANFIYVKPSSEIGNIGVISSLPGPWKPDTTEITTGPFKVSGNSRKNWIVHVETIKKGFIMAVMSQRGDKLKIDSERLSHAEIFLGNDGVRYGLADSIGTGSEAIKKAANIAGIANYNTFNINKAMNITFSGKFHGLAELNKTTAPTNYYVYLE